VILIDLVYQEGCRDVGALRANLAWALIEAHVTQRWTERVLPAEGGFRSPTILVNGREIGPPAHPDASTKYLRLPSVEAIAEVLKAAKAAAPDVPAHRRPRATRRRSR
jgi:hypothetical protein